MQTDPSPLAGDPVAHQLSRMEASIGDINARIARLAIALGASLKTDEDVNRIISRPRASSPEQDRRSGQERRLQTRVEQGPDRRVAHQWEELRGLLVLRYGVEKRYVDELGVDVTRHIMVEAEHKLEREGFAPGADGVDIERLFDGS